MAYTIEKNGQDNDIVISGWETGIATSPHKGVANIQNANISTETGEVMTSFARTQASMTSTSATGNLAFLDSSHVTLSISTANTAFKGMWITVSNSSHAGELPNGNYYVMDIVTGNNAWTLSTSFTGSAVTGFTAGLTATINLIRTVGLAVAYSTELYFNGGTQYARYYVLDNQGLVWVYDTINDLFPADDTSYWFLPDTSITYWSSDTTPSGLTTLNGNLLVFSGNKIWTKPTVNLGTSYVQMTNAILMSSSNSSNPHFGFSGHQGRAYYTDGAFVGSIFPDTSLLTGVNNVQSYASYTTSTTTGTISQLYSGTTPSTGANVGATGFSRIPAVFFPSSGGSNPAALSVNTVYYIQYSTANATFEVYAALTGGVALDITTGASGTQFYNTFWVIGTHSGAYGDTATTVFTPQRLALPVFEVAQCLVEVGNNVLVGCRGTVVYPWNQVDATPSGLINLPEANVKTMVNVNQMAYLFAGYKANVYITDGSTASLVIKVPDYCAGIAGTPESYIEPNFTWGGAAYIRGRVYFSLLDQTSTKAGNCGGIWSFIPTQNLYIGQDTGLSLVQENRSSYATYSGYSTVLIPWFDQSVAKAPQFWSCWESSITSPAYGFDKTATNSSGTAVVETDLIPVGTVLKKYTPKQIEYKLSAPLIQGESVAISWRKNSTDAFATAGTVILPDGATSVAGYFNANFQGAQWIQLKLSLTGFQGTSASFTRLKEVRIR